MEDQNIDTDPRVESIPGTPQNVAAKATGDPSAETRVLDIDMMNQGQSIKAEGIGNCMPESWGGGFLYMRSASTEAVQSARTKREKQLLHEVNARRTPGSRKITELSGDAENELTRYTCLMSITGWHPEVDIIRFGGTDTPASQLRGMSAPKLRRFLMETLLPPIYPPPKDDEERPTLNREFFALAVEALVATNEAPAAEVAKVGKAFKLGLPEVADYSD